MQSIYSHNLPPRGKAGGSLLVIFEHGAVTDLLVSLVWAIRKGKEAEEEKWQRMRRFRGRAFLISSQADRQKPAPRLCHGGDALWNLQGVLWLAHLVSGERRRRARLKLRKWDWESGAGLFSSLKPAPFGLIWRRRGTRNVLHKCRISIHPTPSTETTGEPFTLSLPINLGHENNEKYIWTYFMTCLTQDVWCFQWLGGITNPSDHELQSGSVQLLKSLSSKCSSSHKSLRLVNTSISSLIVWK